MKNKNFVMLFFLFLSFKMFSIININSGIVIPENADVYKEPSKSSQKVTSLKKDEIFIINSTKKITDDINDYFLEIKINNVLVGWIHKNDVAINIFNKFISFDVDKQNLKKYIDIIDDDNIELWIAENNYYFDQHFLIFVLSTKSDNKTILNFHNTNYLKIFQYTDINNDGTKDLLIENWWHAFTDPTHGSTFSINTVIEGSIKNICIRQISSG